MISRVLTQVVSKSAMTPRSFSPAIEPASTAGEITRANVTSIPSTIARP